MKFTAGWFKKLWPFAGKREEASSTDEAVASPEKNVDETEEAHEKPSLRQRLLGLFSRNKTSQSIDAAPSESNAEPETKEQTKKAVASTDEAGAGEEAGTLPKKPGMFARLMGVFRAKQKTVEAEAEIEAGTGAEDEAPGKGADKPVEEPPATEEETPKKGLWARVRKVFSRKSKEQSAAELADAGELFSWGEGQAAVPPSEKDGKAEKAKEEPKADAKSAANAGTKGDAKGDAGKEAKPAEQKIAAEEEVPPAGLGVRIRALARNKKVWLLILLVSLVVVVLVVSLTLLQMRTREHTRLLELEKKNKQLLEENKKLQVPRKQAPVQPPKALEAPLKKAPAGGQGKGGDSTDDCTVGNKENAAEVLKRCIDSFNAMDRR